MSILPRPEFSMIQLTHPKKISMHKARLKSWSIRMYYLCTSGRNSADFQRSLLHHADCEPAVLCCGRQCLSETQRTMCSFEKWEHGSPTHNIRPEVISRHVCGWQVQKRQTNSCFECPSIISDLGTASSMEQAFHFRTSRSDCLHITRKTWQKLFSRKFSLWMSHWMFTTFLVTFWQAKRSEQVEQAAIGKGVTMEAMYRLVLIINVINLSFHSIYLKSRSSVWILWFLYKSCRKNTENAKSCKNSSVQIHTCWILSLVTFWLLALAFSGLLWYMWWGHFLFVLFWEIQAMCKVQLQLFIAGNNMFSLHVKLVAALEAVGRSM